MLLLVIIVRHLWSHLLVSFHYESTILKHCSHDNPTYKRRINSTLDFKSSQTPIPSSIPQFQNGKPEEQEQPRSDDLESKLNETQSETSVEETEDDHIRNYDGEDIAHDPNAELERIDWNDFYQRHGEKIDQATAIEEELHKEFRMLCHVCVYRNHWYALLISLQSFSYWASAAVNFDEDRGWKR